MMASISLAFTMDVSPGVVITSVLSIARAGDVK
jgi:hypothetical protein